MTLPGQEVGSAASNSQESKGGSFVDGAERFVKLLKIEIRDARIPGAAPLGVSSSVVFNSVALSKPSYAADERYWETTATVRSTRLRYLPPIGSRPART